MSTTSLRGYLCVGAMASAVACVALACVALAHDLDHKGAHGGVQMDEDGEGDDLPTYEEYMAEGREEEMEMEMPSLGSSSSAIGVSGHAASSADDLRTKIDDAYKRYNHG